MTVKDLISQEIDIDVYDDVCEELGIAFCGPMELTETGAEEFSDVLEYGIELNNYCAVVHVDDAEGVWQKKLNRAKKFFHSAAGYCSEDDYNRWFKQ